MLSDGSGLMVQFFLSQQINHAIDNLPALFHWLTRKNCSRKPTKRFVLDEGDAQLDTFLMIVFHHQVFDCQNIESFSH